MLIDDGLQLINCQITHWTLREDGHAEYFIKCKRENSLNEWTVSRRYREFHQLNKDLKCFGVRLGMPAKKYIGKTNAVFLDERKKELQGFIDIILLHHLLQCSLFVAKFFEYPDCDIIEFQQWMMVSIRNRKNFVFKQSWDNVSWRYFKCYALLERQKENFVLSLVPYGPDCVGEGDTKLVLNFLSTFVCSYLCPNLECWADVNGVSVIRPLMPNGVLRDILHKCKPEGSFIKKYGVNAVCYSLNFADIVFIARQMLEMLFIFLSISFPFTDIHCGNVRITELGCEILDYEFVLTGQSGINRQTMIRSNKIKTIEDMMVFNFGFFLYELLTGLMVFPEQEPHLILSKISEPFQSLLRSIFIPIDKLPTFSELISCSIFSEILFERQEKNEIRIPTKVKAILDKLCEQKVKRLAEDQRTFGLRTKMAAVQSLLIEKRVNVTSTIKVFK